MTRRNSSGLAVRTGALAAVLIATVAVGGCAADPEQPGVATAVTAGPPTPSATIDQSIVAAYIDAVREYVACMREAGIEMTDPDAKGHTTPVGDLRLLKADPKFLAAGVKCSPLHPPVPKELEERPKLTAEEIENARKYADCMQTHGAPDFPDPEPDGHFPDRTWDQAAAAAIRAGEICEPIVGGPATRGPGQG